MSFLLALPKDRYARTAFAEFSPAGEPTLGIARALIWSSQLAYETSDPGKIADIGRLWGLEAVEPFKQPAKAVLPMSSTRGVIARKANATLIVFAGTDPLVLQDWIADVRFRPSADHLHVGFQDAVDAVWNELNAVIQQASAAGRPLFFAGHSLGGALAVVAAERALREGKIKTARVFTYGMPRVGNAAFVSRYAALAPTTYRFVHGLDIIPSVPPEKLDFRHVGQEFHCASGGKFAVDSEQPAGGAGTSASRGGFFRGFVESVSRLVSPPASPSFRNDTLGRLYEFLPAGIGDHLPDRYYHALGEGER